MVSNVDLTLSFLNILFQAFVVYFFIARGLFRKFLFFNLYFLLSITVPIARYGVLFRFGQRSQEYFYTYYSSDAALMIFLFLAICQLSTRLAGSKIPGKIAAYLAAGALAATAWLSFSNIPSGTVTVVLPFVNGLTRNVYFLCCFSVVLLWAWTLKHKPDGPIEARFLMVLDVYLALSLIPYAAHQLVPPIQFENLSPMIAACLPLGCCFTLTRSDAREN